VAASKRLEDGFALSGRDSRPLVDHVEEQLPVALVRTYVHRRAGRRELQCIVQQVHEHALDLHRIDPDGRRVGVDVDHHSLGVRPELLDHPLDELLRRPELRMRGRDSALEARQVEQVPDDAVETVRLTPDSGDELDAIFVRETQLRIGETGCRGHDRRQRGAQVVRDGVQNGGLDGVAPPERLGLEHFLRHRSGFAFT